MRRVFLFWLVLLVFVASEQDLLAQKLSPEVSTLPQPSQKETSPPSSSPSSKGIAVMPGSQSELSLFEDIPIVVTASKKPKRITEAPAIISVLTEVDIARMGARTIIDVLRTIPGIEIMKDELNLSQIAVRGLRSETSAGVKILVDGHALNDPISGGATRFYDDLPLKNVRLIEIIRGPASAIYGANAFVSVVNIITKSAQEIDGIEVSLGGGRFRTFNPSLLLGKTWNEVDLTLYANYYTTDGAELSVDADALSSYDDVTRPLGFAPISQAPGILQEGRERFDLSWKLAYRDLTFTGKYLDQQRGPFLTDFYTLNDDSTEDARHFYADIEYRRFLTERVELSGRLYADYFEIDAVEQAAPGFIAIEDYMFPLPTDEIYRYPNGLISTFYAKSWRIGGEDVVNYRLFENNDLTLGIAYEYLAVEEAYVKTNLYNAIRGYPPDELQDLRDLLPDVESSFFRKFAAIFAQDTWKVRHNFELTVGVRGDYFDDVGGVFTPKIGISYRPDRAISVKALFGSAFRVPSFSETFVERPYPGSAAVGDLVIEELRTFEIGVGFKPVEWLVGEVNYFLTDINKLTEVAEDEETSSYPIGTTRAYKNVGGIDVQGVEIELRGKSEREIDLGIIPRLMSSSFRINYSYQDTQDSTTHAKVPNMARHKGNIGIGFNLSAESPTDDTQRTLNIFRSFSNEFSLYANLFLCGKRERSPGDLREPLPAFGVLDLTLTAYDVFHKGFDVSFSIQNLLDEDYRDPAPELTEDHQYATIPDDFPNPGRSFFLELKYTF